MRARADEPLQSARRTQQGAWGAGEGGNSVRAGSGTPGWAAQGGAALVVVAAVHAAMRPLAAAAAAARSLPGQLLPCALSVRPQGSGPCTRRSKGGRSPRGSHAPAGAAGRVGAAVVPAPAGAPSTAAVLACFALVVALQALLGAMADLLPRLAQVQRQTYFSIFLHHSGLATTGCAYTADDCTNSIP